ncbi:hypothetical protein, partial [Myroides indicus]|uniref:hypothetical protein n=1 Tax=Myroides indicus TaxID=1323422 RepID=UPI001AAF834A
EKRLAFNKTTNQAPKKNGAFILYSCTKKEQKDSKDKADTHRTAQPKAYGIMAGQKRWLRRIFCVALPPFGIYSVSFWFFRLSALIEWLSFFSVFFFWKKF